MYIWLKTISKLINPTLLNAYYESGLVTSTGNTNVYERKYESVRY